MWMEGPARFDCAFLLHSSTAARRRQPESGGFFVECFDRDFRLPPITGRVISVVNCGTVQLSSQPPATPPSCSDCTTTTQPVSGAPAAQSPSRMWQSSSGQMRFDTPNASIITDPAAQRAIMLDHVKKEAMVMPMAPASPSLLAGAAPAAPGAPQVPAMQVQDLGKSMIEGHEVQGKQYTLPPLPAPPNAQMPAAAATPASPQAPAPPQSPQMPTMPKPPQPSVTQIWTSVKLGVPVLTKVSSAAGEQTTYCKPTSTQEPHPSIFQIPPDYKVKSS